MQPDNHIYKLKGKIQYYAWGGSDYLPALLGIPNTEKKPFAEYWMGAHTSAPAEVVLTDGEEMPLSDFIRSNPAETISESVNDRFNGLPYLFKVLDVKDMLSIQVHPSKAAAEKGYDREDAAGIPLNAPNRNYKDRNHKPEVMVALSEFWLLHGFRSKAALEIVLEDVPEFNVLLPLFRKEGLKSMYQFVMEMQQDTINTLLAPLIKREVRRKQAGELQKFNPGWWVAKLYEGRRSFGDIDRGIFSVYLFNILELRPGQAIFQAAGVPHAYLEGQNVELMANSDNVLRGGLTPKHVDVAELMNHMVFEETIPAIMNGEPGLTGELLYPCPVPDFGISKIELAGNLAYTNTTTSLEIIIAVEGGALVNNGMMLKRGEVIMVPSNQTYTLEASGKCVLFRAYVPVA